MCLIIYKNFNKTLPENFNSILENAWECNPHGAGIAYRSQSNQSEISYIKGMLTLDALKNEIEKYSSDDYELIIHVRWATSGAQLDTKLCHPFLLDGKKHSHSILNFSGTDKEFYFHNGVMFHPQFNSGYSDTCIMARIISLQKTEQERKELLESYTNNNRFVLMKADKTELLGDWFEHEGLLYSNHYSWDYSIFYPDYRDFDVEGWGMYNDVQFGTFGDIPCPCCGGDTLDIGNYQEILECEECGTISDSNGVIRYGSEVIELEKKAV